MTQTKTTGKWKAFLWVFISLTIMQVHAHAQNQHSGAQKVSGRVISGSNGDPVSGATITVKGTQNAVVSNEKGEFTIVASPDERLVISFIGFAPKETIAGSSKFLNIILSESYSHMEDVVVVGYGKMKKTDMSSAVISVSAADIKKTVNTTIDQALQGRAANVYVASNSGQPGAGSSVIIRGVSSITGNSQPLYVIDGVQIRPDPPSDNPYSHPQGFANQLSGLNPDDIDNISVLEGAAATSIFGAAGANGVLMITTKHGKAGQTKISAASSLTIQDLPEFRPVMDLKQYAIYTNRLAQLGVKAPSAELADPSILGPGTNWQAAMFRRTLMQKHSLALSGGSDKSTFFVSGEYLKQEGMALGSGFTRGSIRLNLDNQATKWLKFGTNINGSFTRELVNTTNSDIINLSIIQNPSIPVKNPDGSWGGPAPAQATYSFSNPIAIAALNNDYNQALNVLGGMYADVTPLKGLVWHTEINGNIRYSNNYVFEPSYNVGAFVNPNTKGRRAAQNTYWWSVNTRVQYELRIQKHSITAMIGHEAQSYGWQNLSASGQNYSTNSVQELTSADATTIQATSNKNNGAQESYFGRLNYVYNDRYIAQFVMRRDGSSNFGPANLFGNFPAASVAWRISQENFMKNIPLITDLKLRAEYGVSGNAGNNGGAIYAGLYSVPTPWGGGWLPKNFPNPSLKWEQDKTFNAGLDLYMLNSRVELIGDFYIKDISNLLLVAGGNGVLGGSISGGYQGNITWPVRNVGNMRNTGFGITVNTVNILRRDFQWKTGGNFSVDRNKVTALSAPITVTYTTNTNNSQAIFKTDVGQPASMITGYIAEGLFRDYKDISGHAVQTTTNGVMTIDPAQGSWVGDIKFKDINGDGVVDQKDRTIIGNPWPKFTYNFNTSFTYKGFDLNLFFTGVSGNNILNLTRYLNEMPLGTGVYSNHYQSVMNFAQPSSNNAADALTATLTNPGHNIPRVVIGGGDPNQNVRLTQWSIEDGSYLKLKNVRLSYTVPYKFLSATHVIRGLTASVQAQNVFTITKYTGYDPEVGMFNYGGITLAGIDNGRYPSTRSYTFSMIVDF